MPSPFLGTIPSRAVESFGGAYSTEYTIYKQHERDAGVCQLAVASPDGSESCEIVDLHDPVEVLAIYWTATKRGGPPVVPSPYSFAPDHVFISGTRTVASPIILASGQAHDWQMNGVYYYALTSPYDLTSPITAPVVPADGTITIDQTTIPSSNFVTGLLATSKNVPFQPAQPLQAAIPKTTP